MSETPFPLHTFWVFYQQKNVATVSFFMSFTLRQKGFTFEFLLRKAPEVVLEVKEVQSRGFEGEYVVGTNMAKFVPTWQHLLIHLFIQKVFRGQVRGSS